MTQPYDVGQADRACPRNVGVERQPATESASDVAQYASGAARQ
jgi:hypothetical protein